MFHSSARGKSIINEKQSDELPAIIDPSHKGHMFTIAASKVNNTLTKWKLKPIFEISQAQDI